MVLKSKYLISLFATLFLILLGIQVYFMYKTYQVKERDINRSVNDGLINYTDDLQDLHHTKEMKDDDLQRIIIRYYHKGVSQQDFFRNVTENRKAAIKKLDRYLKSRLKKDGYEISARIRYISIVHLPDSTKVIDRPFTIFETKEKVKNSRIASNNTWETSTTKRHDSGNKEIEKSDTFLVKSQTDFDIRNIRSLVFQDLTLLIICCIALLASVLLLYIFTIKNLIKQQKQVEVLHTVVDNISHEFKTPIATLKIASKTLKKEWNPETLPLIDRQIFRLESLLFQLHKEEIPGEANPITPEDWNFFIHDLRFTYPKILFEFENNVSKTLPFDKNLMETVIKNLCENSVKYGASVVGINISHSSENLDIEVSDNGQGIENRELKNIFEKFYRIQGNNIHNTKGLGLGLYIVKKIITNYHGKIEASSKLGKGSIFSLSIPYEMPL